MRRAVVSPLLAGSLLATPLLATACGETTPRCARHGALCEPATRYALAPEARALAAADLDGDGALELITVSGHDGVVSARWGDSDRRSDWYPRGELGDLETVKLALAGAAPLVIVTLPDSDELVTLRATPTRRLVELARRVVGSQPRALAVLERDGDAAELVTLNGGDASLALVRVLADGSLGEPRTVALERPGHALATGDLDGDGHGDVAVAHFDDARVSALFGDGAGGLSPARSWPAPAGVEALEIVELTGDAYPELALQSPLEHTIAILRGAPGRALEPAPALPIGDAVMGLGLAAVDLDDERPGHDALLALLDGRLRVFTDASPLREPLWHELYVDFTRLRARDVDGDGLRDALLLGDELLVQRADGLDLALTEVWRAGDDDALTHVAAGDLDGDGLLDVVAARPDPPALLVWRGRGDGGLELEPRALALDEPPRALTVGDVTGDGRADALLSTWSDEQDPARPARVQLARATGELELVLHDPIDAPLRPGALVTADLDGDGRAELLIGFGPGEPDPAHDAGLALLRFSPAGELVDAARHFDDRAFHDLTVRALDDDGRDDLVALTQALAGLEDEPALPTAAQALLGAPGPSLTLGPALSSAALDGQLTIGLHAVDDLDHDGALDVVACVDQLGAPALVAFLGGLEGAPVDAINLTQEPPISHCEKPHLRDLDGDGALDILSYAPQRRELSILRGDGAGFAPRVELAAPDSVAFALADLDGDGHDELLEVGDAGLRVRRVRDSPQLTTIRSAALAAPNARPLLRAGDIDGDGATDLLVANWRDAERASSREDPEFDYSSLWWLRGDGDGGFTSAEYARAPDRTGAALADLDGDGAAELIVSVPHELAVLGWRDEPGAFVELHAAASGSLEALRVVDLDRDGRLDVLGRDKRALVVLHGAGDLEFEPAIETAAIEATGAEVLGLVVADLDQDGALEVLTWVYGQPGLQRLRPRPDRRWSAPEELPTPGPVFGLDVGDLDQDGVLELALKVLEDDVYWWTRLELDEDGELRGPFVLRPANSGWRSRLVDWDADGRLDLLDHGDEFTILLLGADQRGDRLPNYTPARLPGAGALELVDLDRDGARDLALLNTSAALAVYFGGAP